MNRRALLKGLAAAGAATAVGPPTAAARTEARVALPDAVGMLYDATRCVGCKACVVACRQANGLAPTRTPADGGLHDMQTELDGGTKTVIKLYQEAGEESFVKRQCMHCVDPTCVSVCMIGAMKKGPRGIVTYDKDTCIGCRYCQIACPFEVPKFQWSSATPVIVKCELCKDRVAAGELPACVDACPREAVIFGTRTELLEEAHRRLAAAPDRYQPKVYGEHDGGGTQVLYLAAVAFEKLGLPALSTESLAAASERIQHGVYQGFITPAVLYAGVAGAVVRNWRKKPHRSGPEGE